jgi:uncharacterized pyridoxamine 5'-phosphate oxidase family protein
LVGKKYYKQLKNNNRFVVEVLSETLTHVYLRVEGTNRRWNAGKWYFKRFYKEL